MFLAQVNIEGCGIYDNIGHGVQTEGDVVLMNNDILCNQRNAVSAEGTANIQVRGISLLKRSWISGGEILPLLFKYNT